MANNKTPATNANILKAVRSQLSFEAQNHIPKEIDENLTQIFDDILNYQPLRNEVVPCLVQLVGLQTVDSVAWRNPLARFKKAPMRYGSTHEETYVNMCKGKVYDALESYEYAFKQYQSYIMSVFHNINLKIQYPVTITFDNLRNAFLSEFGIRDMMSAKMESCITGANWDEYLAMKGLIDTCYSKGLAPALQVETVVDEESAKNVLTAVKTAVYEFTFPNPANNIAGATSASRPYSLIWITTPQVNANISVEALAYAFNMDKADVEVQTVIVDNFKNASIQGVLVDVRFFNVRDQLREMSDQRLANVLSWNYFYTVWEMISASPFYPIRVFTSDTVVTDVSISLTAGSYTPGTELKLASTLTSATQTGYIQKLVDYEIVSGATSKHTYILPGTNILITGQDETGSIQISATYRLNQNVTVTSTFTPVTNDPGDTGSGDTK